MSYCPYCKNCNFSYLRHDADGKCWEKQNSYWDSTAKKPRTVEAAMSGKGEA